MLKIVACSIYKNKLCSASWNPQRVLLSVCNYPVCSNIEKEEFYAKFSSYESLRWILSFSSRLVRDKVNICVILVVIVITIIIGVVRRSNVYIL